MSEQTQISIDRLRAAWITYRSVAWSWFDVNDEDGNDGEDFDAWLESVKQEAADYGWKKGREVTQAQQKEGGQNE